MKLNGYIGLNDDQGGHVTLHANNFMVPDDWPAYLVLTIDRLLRGTEQEQKEP